MIAFYLNEIVKYFLMKISTLCCNLKMMVWGIKHGRCRFYGYTLFQKLPNSTIEIGENCEFRSRHDSNQIGVFSPCMISTIKPKATIIIGDNCGFSGTVIGAALSVTIGKNVRCGANTLITDTDWHNSDERVSKDEPVVIEDNVWLGYGVKVMKGVRIGKNSLIGLGSIVTKDIPANCIAAGNPCNVIRMI